MQSCTYELNPGFHQTAISQRINVIGKDGNEPIRCILKMNFSTIETRTKVFSIRNSDNAYSNEYVELTKEFHGVEL